jgi:hypothetical protein
VNQEQFETSISNPSLFIYQQYEGQILSTRNNLFVSLNSQSKEIGKATKKILERKFASSNSMGLPNLFEIFPWLLKDLTGLNSVKTCEISLNWLALYLYVSFLDDHLDLKTKIEPDEFIAASVLAQTSLINLFKIVDNTKYEVLFKECLIRSAKFELQDVIEQSLVCIDSFTKSESASGKNAILLACAGAIAASNENDCDFIVEITHELLLCVQLLDDITDFEEDLKRGNITIPLNDFIREVKPSNLSKNTMFEFMLQSNSLIKVLARIEISLTKVVDLIHTYCINIQQTNPALQYFLAMLNKVGQLKLYIESIEGSFENLSPNKQETVRTEFESKLVEIYCHT